MDTSKKVVSLEELLVIIEVFKGQGKKIVTTNGAFDILHIGQKRMLEQSKFLGDVLIVGVNSDSSVKEYKSDLRPIIPEAQRAEIIAALACVDYVTIFNEPDPVNLLASIKPAIHTKGGDYDSETLIETATVRKNGGRVVIVPGRIQSTTNIIDRIAKAYGGGSD
ncbi:MAG: Bifunctional protein HldE [Parcubacteria group bacterium GW2011_GWF2_44_8b]|nr:MAG: Bifunctional protein HldE [Parcubacteria group bacterium GW2011_GWC1_43_30]KKT79456.1 MAG: Bifunctional protein HldE [Parcubacteria group bacterium GW2011_GWF2_44_8b]KKT85716.1 MAG: Bifunctional protein HldE [Parcubacteria group bacterium GW2011_GWD1_44_9]